jgi:CubicO group peptidase (beta-lactamase class C family)
MKFLILLSLFSSFAYASDLELTKSLSLIKSKLSVPALAGALIIDGKIKEIAAVGIRKVGYSEKVTTQDKFHLGSCTKSMTATLAGLLVEKNLLSWNSTLEELLPGYDLHPKYKNITYDLLLAHRSGLRRDTEGFEGGWLYTAIDSGIFSPKDARDLVTQALLRTPPMHTAKQDYQYSNIGYMIAGFILERLTNTSYDNLMEQYIFDPLNMKSCGFGEASVESNLNPKQPWGHKIIKLKNYVLAVHDDNPPAFDPAGRAHCNLVDWGKYLTVHLNGFNKKSNFLKQTTFNKLHMLYPAKGSDYTYGGWVRVKRQWAGGDVLHHTGTNTYNFANTWLAPNKNKIIMSTTNIMRNGFKATDSVIGDINSRNP